MKYCYSVIFLLLFNSAFGQVVIDSCFTSANVSTNFVSSAVLANNDPNECDLMEWDGSAWSGAWPLANITIPPPGNIIGARAIFMGASAGWTTGGEGFCMKLNSALVSGQTYTFDFTYVSHGTVSNGNFAPFFYTGNIPSITGAYNVGNLVSAGNTWVSNPITFTATAAQNGHTWITIHTGLTGSSGIVYQLCNPLQSITCDIDLGNDTTLCQGETFILDATTTNATYLWQDNSTNPTFNVTQPGTYWVEITENNCIATDTIIVNYNPLPIIDLGNDTTLCLGETLTLDATSANATYIWQDNSTNPTLNISQQGVYSIEVTQNNCTTTDTVIVNYIPLNNINIGNDTTLCQGETLSLDATTTNATYLWQDNSTNPTFNVTQLGTYWVEVTENNCIATDTIIVNYNPLPIIDLGNDTTLCLGETLTLDATSANSTYIWQDNSTSPTFTASSTGAYWVQVNNGLCINSDTINILVNDILIDLGPDIQTCNPTSIVLNAQNPGSNYLWQDNSINQTNNVSTFGTYWVEVEEGNCTASDTIIISQGTVNVNLPNDTLLCAGSTLLLNAQNPGATYNWSDGSNSQTLTVNTSGTYWVEVIDGSCFTTDTIVVNYSPLPIINLGSDTSICIGETLLLDATTTNTTYLWQDNSTSPTFTASSTGAYWVQVNNGLCINSDTINILVNNILIDLGPDIQTCNPTSIVLNAQNPGSNYLWQDNSINQTNNVSTFGTYWVEVEEDNCTASDTILISPGFITVNLPNDTLLCAGSTLLLNAQNSGATYNWSDGSNSQTLTVNTPGTYWVEVTDGSCTAIDSVIIDYFMPTANFSVMNTSGCSPVFVNFTDLSTTQSGILTSWLWSFGDGQTSNQQNPTHKYLGSGSYDVELTITTSNGCQTSYMQQINVIAHANPVASFTMAPNPIIIGEMVFFTDQSSNAQAWFWDFGNNNSSTLQNPSQTYYEPGNYSIQLTVFNETCIDSVMINFDLKEQLIYYVPNSFTPDGDLINNTFKPIFTKGFDTSDYNLLIFNRWGELIFESLNYEIGWDGTYGGSLVKEGTYIYKIEFGDSRNDERHTINGHVNLLR